MELFINDQSVKLGDSIPAITKKSIDIENPTARFVDISNTFQLPDCVETREILESPQIIASNNRSHDKKYNAVLADFFPIFRGHGFLELSNRNTLNFQLVDESKDIFKALDTKLTSINWDDLDTELTQTAIDALRVLDFNTLWFWGKLCLHEDALRINTDQTTGDSRCKYSRPSLLIDGLLKRIVELNGYAYIPTGNNLAISCFHEYFYFTSYQKHLNSTYIVAGSSVISGLNSYDFKHADVTTGASTINIGSKKSRFRIRGTFDSDSNMRFVITATDNVDPTKVSISEFNIIEGVQTVDFTSSEFYSVNGMTINIDIIGTGSVDIDALLYTILSDRDFDLSYNPFLGYKIKAYDNLPDITYLDLFKINCIVYNKYQLVDTFNKIFTYESLANLNKINCKDWSNKFIIGSENVGNNYKNLSQKNWLQFKNDLTVNQKLGWSYFLTDNESLEKEGPYIDLPFGASIDVNINSNLISQVKIYTDTERQIVQAISPRIFEINGDKLQFAPINWENLSLNYYYNIFNSLYRIRVIDCQVNINKLDVLTWKPKQLVYIDYFKTTFIVLEISNFIPGRKTKVKLLSYGR